jgi:hypothetical protein
VCDDLGVEELDIYDSSPFIRDPSKMHVSQSAEIVWVFDVGIISFRCSAGSQKSLLTLQQTFSTKDIVSTLGHRMPRVFSHQK